MINIFKIGIDIENIGASIARIGSKIQSASRRQNIRADMDAIIREAKQVIEMAEMIKKESK